ncbi:amidase family protein [Williamsoniiplasma luminosum]|uniref:Asp-tRNA(Asn)/Glu-tRNA(Gln) amidotransferase subunit GatA n=1 Tax=Williamsoniiplasma luminosum TaxID=214888 RepID=A0A2S0NKB9_9MOLU|nr:amidase family protein [Williamsoniiplasma luminosum]AVP49442.1 MAG: Asp-tRNA(Asn)/Glu-tRNA(Gln) amidotransferase subunit GatA [Williamsoniiplasma luminosum]
MNYKNLSIRELHELLRTKKITALDLTKQVIEEMQKDDQPNFLITLPTDDMLRYAQHLDQNFDPNNLLYGIPYVAKDNFSTKNIRTTAGSKILSNYIPNFNATIVELLNQNQAMMAGKVTLDELGMGGTGLHSAYGEISNPYDQKRQIGGSSSGSVYAVAKGLVPFALGTDTGDSIRKPASYVGIVGFKPTYGAISRYGVIPYAPSLDHAGFFTRNVDDMALIADVTFKKDDKDFTSFETRDQNFLKDINDLKPTTKFAYLKEVQDHLPEKIKRKYEQLFNKLKAKGYQVNEVGFDIDLLNTINPVYMMISYPEAISSHANLSGMGFGMRAEGENYAQIMINSRSKYLGEIVKRRFVIGSLNLKQENQDLYFLKAKRVRRLIANALNEILASDDILILPPSFQPAPLIETALEDDEKADSDFLHDILVMGNFAGIPSITIPFTTEEAMPIGINLNAGVYQDKKLLQAAKVLEDIIGIKNRIVGDKKYD